MVKCKKCGKRKVARRNKYDLCSKCYNNSALSFAVLRTREKDKDVMAFKKRLTEVFG